MYVNSQPGWGPIHTERKREMIKENMTNIKEIFRFRLHFRKVWMDLNGLDYKMQRKSVINILNLQIHAYFLNTLKLLPKGLTKMHSSRMCTVRCSGHHGEEGVSA